LGTGVADGVVAGLIGLAVDCPGVAELAVGPGRQVAVPGWAHPAAARTLASVTAIADTRLLHIQAW